MAGIFIILLVWALGYARAVAMPVTAALLTGLLFGPVQSRLERNGLPPFVAAAAILLGFVGSILLLMRLLVLPFETWSDRLPEMWGALRQKLEAVRSVVLAVQDATKAVQESAGIGDQPSGGGGTIAPEILGNLAVGVPAVAAETVLFLGVLFFFLASRTRIRAQVLNLCRTRASRLRVGRIVQESERAVSGYVGTITLINLGLGAATAAVLFALGTPNAGFWGAMATILNFIPYIGPGLFILLLLGVSLVQEGRELAFYIPAAAFLAMHVVEANLITPTVLGSWLTVEPLLVIISLAFWLWLWGPIGAFMAVPILLVIKVAVLRLAI